MTEGRGAMAERVGFIGLGIMGKPMARNLVRAGYELVLHNRSQDAVSELCAESPQAVMAVPSPRAVAEQASIIITMLPDSPDVQAVVFGADGLLEGIQRGALLIDMSTIAPATAVEVDAALRAQGASALDAP